MIAYVLVIVLAAGGHHQSVAVGDHDQGSCLVAADRLRHKKRPCRMVEVRSGQLKLPVPRIYEHEREGPD
jgi:hypothetical protein